MGGFHKDALPHNFELAEYIIESMLGHGGFGITYLARDRNLDTRVAIKEYFPADLAVRQDIAAVAPKPTPKAMRDYHLGLKNFIKEARALAHFKHPNIVRVLRYIEAHDTAYMVMEYSQGESLADQLRQQGPKLPEAALLRIFLPILNGVRAVHEADMLHLDIKPENIYLRKDGSPMLIDFGSTRQAISQTMPDKFLVTHGYAPIEQYPDKGKQGPWTDLYALGASMYRCISGKRPVNALERYQAVLHYQVDPLTPATVVGKSDYSLQLLGCIDWALQVHPRDRPQSARVFQDRLLGPTTSAQTTVSQTVTVRTSTSTSAPAQATPDRRKKRQPVQRSNRGLVAALLLTIAGASVYFWFERGAGLHSIAPSLPEPATTPAVAPSMPAGGDAVTAPVPADTMVAPTLRQSLRGHTDAVLSLAFSPDSRRIVSAAADGTIRFWDSASGKSLRVLRRHQGAVSAVTYSADGRWLASAGHDGTVKLWEEKSAAVRTEWRGPGNAILALAFSPDGRWLAAAGRDRIIQLWSVTNGKLAHTYPGHHGDVLGLAFSPDGRTLASAGTDRSVRLWNVAGAREPAGLSIYRTAVQALAFSPDGRWLASGTEDRTVRLVETAGTQSQTFVMALASVHALAYSPDGTQLVVGTADKKIQILDAAKGTPLHALEGHQDQVLAVAMSPDGRWLVSAGRDQTVQVWDR